MPSDGNILSLQQLWLNYFPCCTSTLWTFPVGKAPGGNPQIIQSTEHVHKKTSFTIVGNENQAYNLQGEKVLLLGCCDIEKIDIHVSISKKNINNIDYIELCKLENVN